MQQKAITNITSNYRLSILIHQDGLSFYIHTSSKIEKEIERKFNYSANPIEILKSIEKCYETEEALNADFTAVQLLYHHPTFTVVPQAIFDKNYAADYLKYNTRLLQTDTVSYDDNLEKLNARVVYIAYSNLNNYFYEKYGEHDYYHYSSRSLPVLVKNGDGMYLEMMSSHFYITVIENGKLIAHNIFPYETINDVLYYCLFSMQQYKQDPETCKLNLIEKEKDQTLYDLLYTYVRRVERLKDYSEYKKQIICA